MSAVLAFVERVRILWAVAGSVFAHLFGPTDALILAVLETVQANVPDTVSFKDEAVAILQATHDRLVAVKNRVDKLPEDPVDLLG